MRLAVAVCVAVLWGFALGAARAQDPDLNPADYDEAPATMTIPRAEPPTPEATTLGPPKKTRNYPVFNVEFPRVETPFIIGTWIVCASLAKIGQSDL